MPLRFGTPAEFAAVRNLLEQADYTETAVCRRLGLDAIYNFRTIREGRETAHEIRDSLDVLIRLFLDGEYVNDSQIRAVLSPTAPEVLAALGLVRSDSSTPELRYSPALLYPTESLYIVSDRYTNLDSSRFQVQPDFVYAAITRNTRTFLETLPPEPCESILDLCAGTGIAALVAASRYAQHAWAFDITERSTRFAEFNRLLNGIANLTAAQGDLYEPAGEQTFDRIVAHPPYIPAEETEVVFRDGGEDGEQVTRRIVEGLPRYLRPGGRFYGVALGTDREGGSYEQRIRQWLGEKESDFDVMLIAHNTPERQEFTVEALLKTDSTVEGLRRWNALCEKLHVTGLFYGSVVVQRKRESHRPFTVRRNKGPHSGCAAAEWLLRWETAAADPDIVQLLLDSRPIASPSLELHVVHRMRNGELNPTDYALRTQRPFPVESQCQSWMAFLISRCDGTITVREHFDYFKQNNVLRPDMPPEEFTNALRGLISGGFLEIEGFRPPVTEEQ